MRRKVTDPLPFQTGKSLRSFESSQQAQELSLEDRVFQLPGKPSPAHPPSPSHS